jgi:cytoskeletal protein RodZ
MSGNKGKNTIKKAAEAAQSPMATRVVAIPKTPEVSTSKTERIGDILRRARLERDDDIYHIAEYLRIKPSYLVALENSQYSELPADAYVIGFLRTYASFLGINGKDAVDRYRYEMAGRRKKPILSMPVPMSEGPAPSGLIMVGATIVVLLIYVLWYAISSTGRTEKTTAPALPSTVQQVSPTSSSNTDTAAAGLTAPVTTSAPINKDAPAVTLSAPAPATSTSSAIPPVAPGIIVGGNVPQATAPLAAESAPQETAESKDTSNKDTSSKDASKDASKDKDGRQIYGDANVASRIIIRATQSSWVMVTDDSGKAIFDHVLKTGDVYKVPNKKGLSLTTGNGTGIVLSLDGKDLPKVASGAPHVVRNISLDPDQLVVDPSASDH